MKKTLSQRIINVIMMLVVLTGATIIHAEGLLPSLTETVGIALPSMGEALGRYPDSETENADGSVTELFTDVSESDFNTFSIYLEQQGAELAGYSVQNGILTAEIRAKGVSFSLEYAGKTGDANVTYPAGTFDGWVKNAMVHFDIGQKLLSEGKTDEAYAEIFSIPHFMAYGPVDSLMKNDGNFAAAAVREAKLAKFKEVGNIVIFGAYPQTAAGTDNTPIEWIVLDYDEVDHKALLLSRCGLEAKPFDTEFSDTPTWGNCTLRTWLNSNFLKKAFSATEQKVILTIETSDSTGQGYIGRSINDADSTLDKVFLLSEAEANRYLEVTSDNKDNTKSRATPTEYAIKTGAYTSKSIMTSDGNSSGWWWLRSLSEYSSYALCVGLDGSLGYNFVYYDDGVVRPAFWLDLDLLFKIY